MEKPKELNINLSAKLIEKSRENLENFFYIIAQPNVSIINRLVSI